MQYLSNSANLPYPLFYQQAAASGGQSSYPFYLFDLTSIPQRTKPQSDEWTYPAIAYRLFRNWQTTAPTEANNRYVWSALGHPYCTGASTTYTWMCERKPSRLGPIASGLLDWIDIRMGIRGPTQKPCNVYAALVQMAEEFTPPTSAFRNTTGDLLSTVPTDIETKDTSVDASLRWNEFYMALVDSFVSHPLNKRDPINIKGLKVLKMEKFLFNPTSTFENDAAGHKKEIKWFINMNRKLNFQWEKQSTVAKDTEGTVGPSYGVPVNLESNANVWDTANPQFAVASTTDDVQCSVHPSARVYLMVFGESFTPGAYTAAENASFELLIRKKHSVLTNL